jgi:hypothetical protein
MALKMALSISSLALAPGCGIAQSGASLAGQSVTAAIAAALSAGGGAWRRQRKR